MMMIIPRQERTESEEKMSKAILLLRLPLRAGIPEAGRKAFDKARHEDCFYPDPKIDQLST